MSQVTVSELRGIASTLFQVTVPTGHTFEIKGALDLDFTGAHKVPGGSTADRPSTTGNSIGLLRFNTDSNIFEVYDGAVWGGIGNASAGASGDIGSYNNPAISGIALRDAGKPTGYYWIQPVGYDTPRYCYVDNTLYDGGWVLVMAVGSSGTTHYSVFDANNLYSATVDGIATDYVPFSGTGYSTTATRRWDDTFIRDVASNDNGGEEVINVRVARNGAQPPGNEYDTYAGGTTADWRYASFVRYNRGIQYFSSLNTGLDLSQGGEPEGSFSVSHVYPYNWERPGGYDHIQLYNNNYKLFDYHSNPSSNRTSRYSQNRVLWGYTGNTSNGIYGGSDSFTGGGQGNSGYMFVR